MVNTGNPSGGCYMCRARRIKCDESKPSCMRCQMYKSPCPGYRDRFELKLHDEPRSSKRKLSTCKLRLLTPKDDEKSHCSPSKTHVTTIRTTSRPTLSEADLIEFANIPQDGRTFSLANSGIENDQSPSPRNKRLSGGCFCDQPAVIQQPLSIPMDQQAVCFLLANYVLIPGPNSITSRGYLDIFLPLIKSQPANSPLTMAFTSVGLATMAVRPNFRELMPMASSSYIRALKQIHLYLKDPSTATNDTTLAMILLLTVFEQLMCTGMDLKGWDSHLHGAVEVIKSRGNKGFKTKIARGLFIAVRDMMTIHFMAESLPIEPSVEWWINGIEYSHEDEITRSYARYNLRVGELRQDNLQTTTISPHTSDNIAAVLALLQRAQDLEKSYREWCTSLPPHWKPDAISWVDLVDLGMTPDSDLSKSVVHPGRVDTFNELPVAFSHNGACSSQILIWTTILRCVAWLHPDSDYRITKEYQQAAMNCKMLIENIVASMPYFFGWNADTDPRSATNNDGSLDHSIKGVSGLFLVWPLFVATTSDFCSDSQRVFLRGRLTFIAENLGICQARILLNATLRHPSRHILYEKTNLKIGTSPTESSIFSDAFHCSHGQISHGLS